MDWWAVRLPAIVLAVVAATQMMLASTADLSPWKGGGFGMFASIDGRPFRQIRIFVAARDRSEELAVPLSLDDAAARAAAFPRAGALRSLATAVVVRERRKRRPVETVRLEVWKTGISSSLESTSVKLCEITVQADAVVADGGERVAVPPPR